MNFEFELNVSLNVALSQNPFEVLLWASQQKVLCKSEEQKMVPDKPSNIDL